MGRTKLFKTPEEIYGAFKDYVTQVKSNPRKKMVFVGKDGKKEWEDLEAPLTYEGFKIYCHAHHCDVHHYFENTDGRYEEYREVCTRVKDEIRNDQITGGMVGQYNPSITQRLNGLVEKTQTQITEQPLFGDNG